MINFNKLRYTLNLFGLPSLTGKGRLMTYLLTSSSLARLKSLRMFEALLGPLRLGTELSVNPGISYNTHKYLKKNKQKFKYSNTKIY